MVRSGAIGFTFLRDQSDAQRGFSSKVLVNRGIRTPCTACLKKDAIPLYAQNQFVMYRLKIVTEVYMKL